MMLYWESGQDLALEEQSLIDGEQFYFYADSAFIVRPWVQVAFATAVETVEQSIFNSSMKAALEPAEWREVQGCKTTI